MEEQSVLALEISRESLLLDRVGLAAKREEKH